FSAMRIFLLPLFALSVYAERDRTSCFNYIDCLEQAQLQFKTCSGGTAVALSLERRTKLMSEMMDDRRRVLETCQTNLRKESLDFDTLQSLVNEDSRECFQKIPFTPAQPIPDDCDYPLTPLPSREIPHGRCLGAFQRDRHQCEKLLRCCPEHNACAERMNALSIAYQIARKKSREISDRMMECISEETAKENERIAEKEEEETKEESITFPTLSPTTPLTTTARTTKKLWVPNKIARLPKSIVGEEEIEEKEEEEEETTVTSKPRRVKISEKIVPSSDGGMPFNRPDRAMRKRIEKRLQLTPSALLEKNREDFFQKFEKEEESTEKEKEEREKEESSEEEPNENRKVAIVKFLLEKADAEMTEKVITMLASGDLKGLMEMEKKERKRRKSAILKALPAEAESDEEMEEKMKKRVSIESVIKQTLEKVSSDHKEQKKALMKNIKSALVEQKQSMEKMVQVAKEREAEESAVTASIPELTTVSYPEVPSSTPTPAETTKKAEEIEKSILEKKEAKLSAELRERIGLENEFRKINGEETTTVETVVAQTEEISRESTHKKLDIRPIFDSADETTSRPILDSDVVTEVPSTTLATVTIGQPEEGRAKNGRVTRHLKKKRGKGSRHARRTKSGVKKMEEPSENFCLSYGQCESLAWEYEQRCDKKFNPITVTFGIEDSHLRTLLLNNSKSDSSVVTQVCLRPVDKAVHNSVLQLQHIERGVRKACLSLGRDKPTLTKEQKDECRILSRFSVIEMEDWLEQTHGHTQANLAECQARTAGIAASCQELSSCCSAVSACEEYISSSPVLKMRVEAIQLLLAQQDDCEGRMEKTLKQLHQHFRLRPAKR
ncbi:hypothetical protein PMAYCL1PPCAC_07016, partial [Pristionchus mayeri]